MLATFYFSILVVPECVFCFSVIYLCIIFTSFCRSTSLHIDWDSEMEEDDSSSNSSDSSIEDRQVHFSAPVESSSDEEIGLIKSNIKKSEAVKIKINLNEPSLKSRFNEINDLGESNSNKKDIVNKPANDNDIKHSKIEETKTIKSKEEERNSKTSQIKALKSTKLDSSDLKYDTSESETEDTDLNLKSTVSKTVTTDLKSPSSQSDSKESKLEAAEYDPKNVHYEGDLAVYTDPKTGYQYKWCKDKNEWLPKGDVTYGFEDDTHTYTDADGLKYFWDVEKNAWFPKIDDDFMAQYQMNYGFIDNKTEVKKEDSEEEDEDEMQEEFKVPEDKEKASEKGVKRKLEPAPPSWFEMGDQQNTKVYVSNLPTDITEEEFVDLMQKCGLVMRDVQTGKMKVKLYTVSDTDILKGDGLCTYIKIESVELALNLLDGYLYKEKRLSVERAKFQMKGDYNPNLKPKKKRRKDKDKLKKMQEKLFDWRPEKMRGERAKHERVVIVKNLFEPTLFDREVSLILEYQQDLRDECSKCGDVRRVMLYDRHPEGVAQITMKDPEAADACVTLLNGRWFGQRKLIAAIWDGKTKFKIAETDSEITSRIDNWDKFLEMDGTTKPEDVKTNAEVPKSEEAVIKVPRTEVEQTKAIPPGDG